MSSSNLAYRPDIDGLRGVAVLAVIAFHAFPQFLPGGFVGVDVFFVISGYLISGIILGKLSQGPFSFREFYARRIARIFPALIVVILAALVVGWFTMRVAEFRRLGTHSAAGGAFFVNVVLWGEAGYFDRAADLKPLLHLWSLAVEEQFYLLWPPLLFFAAKRRSGPIVVIAALGAASLILNLAVTPAHPTFAFYLPFTRLWELALGGYLAHRALMSGAPIKYADAASIVGVAMIVTAALATPREAFPGWWVMLPVVGSALVIGAGPESWTNRLLMRRSALVGVGLISYPLYLWHWPVLSFARQVQPEALTALRTIGFVALSMVLAWATYVAIEKPIRFGRFSKSPRRSVGLVAAMAFVVACGAVAASGVLPTRLHSRSAFLSSYEYDYRAAYRGGLCNLSAEHTPADFSPQCVDQRFGDRAVTSIVLWGDSHAAHLYQGLQSLADSMRLAIAQFTADSCAPVEDADSPKGFPAGHCARMSRFALDRVAALRPDVVLLASKWLGSSPDRLTRTIDALAASGASRVIVVGPLPQWRGPLPAVMLRHMEANPLDPMPVRLRNDLVHDVGTIETRLIAAIGSANVRFVSALGVLCAAGECLTLVNGEPATWDESHLTTPASRLLVRAALASLPIR